MTHPSLEPGQIGPIELHNRVIKTATYEGMTPEGRVTPDLIRHHAELARRGVALTTVAYGAVEDAGRTFQRQLLVDRDSGLRALTDAVHAAGGRASLQLAHCGGFSKRARPPKGPSTGWNAYGTAAGRPWVRAMDEGDLERVIRAFARAAETAVDEGFDAIEIHAGHGYLLSQFLSPVFNRRTDGWGGTLQGRLRLPISVIEAVVRSVGDRAGILVKLNLSDGVAGGLTEADAPEIARAFERAGAHALVTSGGLVQKSAFYLMRGEVPLAGMASVQDGWLQGAAMRLFGRFLVRPYAYTPGFFVDPGRAVVQAVDLPVVALGGLDSAEQLGRAHAAGYAFVAMGRALLADPDFVERLAAGEEPVSRCDHCNRCVVEMDRSGVRCVIGAPGPDPHRRGTPGTTDPARPGEGPR